MKQYVSWFGGWKRDDGTILVEMKRPGEDKPYKWYNLGDWAPSFETPDPALVHTFYYWLCASNVSKVAGILGQRDAQFQYAMLCDEIEEAFHKVFYDEAFEKDVTLRIEDHTAPKGIALPKNQYASLAWPEASECVGYLYDLSGIASIEYKNGVPDYQLTGDYLVPVVVTDWYNNSTVIEVPFHVTDDHNAPLFYGIHDITVGDAEDTVINYLDGITVTDDYDEDPFVMVDSSRVQIGEPGIYTVSYIAKDVAGNIRRQDTHVTIKSTDTDESADKKVGTTEDWLRRQLKSCVNE